MNSTLQPASRPKSPLFVSSLLYAQNSSRFLLFVFNRLRTLSFSVSRNSFVCHSYENCRVCTNNSHSGTRASSLPKNRRPFFSCTYKLSILYPLCFDIHASDGGCTPPTQSFIPLRSWHSQSWLCGSADFPFNFQLSTLNYRMGESHLKHEPPEKLPRLLPARYPGPRRIDPASARASPLVSSSGAAALCLRHHRRRGHHRGRPRQAQSLFTHVRRPRPFRIARASHARRSLWRQQRRRLHLDSRPQSQPGHRAHSRGSASLRC